MRRRRPACRESCCKNEDLPGGAGAVLRVFPRAPRRAGPAYWQANPASPSRDMPVESLYRRALKPYLRPVPGTGISAGSPWPAREMPLARRHRPSLSDGPKLGVASRSCDKARRLQWQDTFQWQNGRYFFPWAHQFLLGRMAVPIVRTCRPSTAFGCAPVSGWIRRGPGGIRHFPLWRRHDSTEQRTN